MTIRNWKAIRSMSLANVHGLVIPPEGSLASAINTMDAVSSQTDEEWITMKAKAVVDHNGRLAGVVSDRDALRGLNHQ